MKKNQAQMDTAIGVTWMRVHAHASDVRGLLDEEELLCGLRGKAQGNGRCTNMCQLVNGTQ